MKILLIAFNVPYDGVAHAGGGICNYYLKKMIADEANDVTVISLGELTEEKKFASQKIYNNLHYVTLFEKRNFSLFRRVKNTFNKIFGCSNYSGFLSKNEVVFFKNFCNKLEKKSWNPDVIICDWTECVFLIKNIKKIFPNAKYIAVEQDVTFLKYQRIYQKTRNIFIKFLRYKIYKNVTRREILSLKKFDKIKSLNEKDSALLLKYGIDEKKISVISPFYKKYSFFEQKWNSRNILFWGAMNRQENVESAIWFIENVMPLLSNEYKFYIIGNHPAEILQQYANDHVIITGFVKSLEPFLGNALCFVVPLLQGAGIKIKILEGFTTGIPVLTNKIGIEGIPAKSQIDYLHCESANEYAEAIKQLSNNVELGKTIGKNARIFVKKTFNYETGNYL